MGKHWNPWRISGMTSSEDVWGGWVTGVSVVLNRGPVLGTETGDQKENIIW